MGLLTATRRGLIKPGDRLWADARVDPELREVAEYARHLRAMMGPNGYVQCTNWAIGDLPTGTPVAVNTFTTVQCIMPAAYAPGLYLPGGTLHPGSTIRLRTWGTQGSTATPATTIGYGLKAVGASAGTSMAVTASQTAVAATTAVWRMEAEVTIVSTGTSGTAYCIGQIVGVATTTPALNVLIPASAPATFTIDTTAGQSISPIASWGTSNALNTYSVYGHSVEVLTAGM